MYRRCVQRNQYLYSHLASAACYYLSSPYTSSHSFLHRSLLLWDAACMSVHAATIELLQLKSVMEADSMEGGWPLDWTYSDSTINYNEIQR